MTTDYPPRPKLVRSLLRDEIRVTIQEAIYDNQLKPGERIVEKIGRAHV